MIVKNMNLSDEALLKDSPEIYDLNKTKTGINHFFLTLISYTVSMVHLSSHLMFPIKYAFFYKTRRQ
jgi:hypothetical protein